MESNSFTDPGQPQSPRRRSIVGPLVLIVIGLAFLAENLGILPGSVWMALWRLWPVWLIVAGLDLLLGRRTHWGSWVVGGVAILLVAGTVGYASLFPNQGSSGEPITISQPIDGASQANVTISSGVARLVVSPTSGEEMLSGVVTPLVNERIDQSARNSGNTRYFEVRSRSYNGFNFMRPQWGPSTWDLRLSDQIPMKLTIDTGVGDARVDLTGLQLTDLAVDTGVGSTEITLPDQGKFRVEVDSGVGDLTLRVPKGLSARIRVDQGVGKLSVDGDFVRSEKEYRSPNFADAQHRVEIDVDGGVGAIRIIQF